MTRGDKKEQVLKWIEMNHEDGLTEAELISHFEKDDIKRGLIRAFLAELQIEKRIEMQQRGRMKIFRIINNRATKGGRKQHGI